MDLPPSRSSLVSWSESKESATAQRAPSGHAAGRSGRPARTWSTIFRHCSSGHCQGSRAGVWTFMGWLNTGSYVGSIVNVNTHFMEWYGPAAECSQYPIWNVYALPNDTYSQHGYTPSGVKTTNTFSNLIVGGACPNASVTRYAEWAHHAQGS